MNEIEHCLFCDQTQEKDRPWLMTELLDDGKTVNFVECPHCYAQGPVRLSEDEAVEWWNEVCLSVKVKQ